MKSSKFQYGVNDVNKVELIEKVKNSKFLYKAYYYGMSAIVNFAKVFVKTDERLILFLSYGGRYFNDSPKSIYEAMKVDPRFKNYKLVWAFREPEKYDIESKVKIDTPQFYKIALAARCWVTNVNVERGLNFTGKNTYYFHTTHGTLPKLNGNDVRKGGFFGWNFKYKYDCSCAQSEIEKQLQLSMYGLKPENVLVCGYPKNDILAYATDELKERIRKKLGIDTEKRVILYAPTFREDNTSEMISPVDFKNWEDILGKEFLVLFRAHPIVINRTNFDKSSSFVRDVSEYPDNVELMIASDILISDYSGIFFEFGILHRPMYCYGYDYEEYVKVRGLYMDLRSELPSGTEDEILWRIKNQNTEEDMKLVEIFISKYISEYGHATKKAIDNIYKSIH